MEGHLVENWFVDNLLGGLFVVGFEKCIVVSDSPVFESLVCNYCYSDNLVFDIAIYNNHVQCDLCHYNYNTQYLNLQI